jgi:hypothetical protein
MKAKIDEKYFPFSIQKLLIDGEPKTSKKSFKNSQFKHRTYLSDQAPFHSASLPQGFLILTRGIFPDVLGVLMSTYLTLVMLYA